MMSRNKNGFKKLRKTCLPSFEKTNSAITPGLRIMFENDNILTLIDRELFGREFSVESGGLYTLRLGAFREEGRAEK